MTFHVPSLIEAGAIALIALIGGFCWTAGAYTFNRMQIAAQRRPKPAEPG